MVQDGYEAGLIDIHTRILVGLVDGPGQSRSQFNGGLDCGVALAVPYVHGAVDFDMDY